MRFLKPLATLARVTPLVKRVDWVGRGEDIKTVAKAVWRVIKCLFLAGATVWAWIMSSAWAAFPVFVGVGLIVVLFGPLITEEWIERRIAKAWEQRRLEAEQEREARDLKKQLPALLPEIEALADGLALELKGDAPPSTVAKNRVTMRRLATLFLANEIAVPVVNDPPRQHFVDWLSGWLMFATTLVARVGGDDYEALTDLFQEVRTVLKQQAEARGTSTALLALLSEKGLSNRPRNR